MLKCPDCHHELKHVVVEISLAQTYSINYSTGYLRPLDGGAWDFSDKVYRCPFCDSLNLDEACCKAFTFSIPQPIEANIPSCYR